MPSIFDTKYYRPNYFQNLWGGGSVPDPNSPLTYRKAIGSSDSPDRLFETGRWAWAEYNGNSFYVCADNRSLFGNVLCRPGAAATVLSGPVTDYYLGYFDQVAADLLDSTWDETYPPGSDAYDFITRNHPPDVVVSGPRATQMAPTPDFALVQLGTWWTNWWGHHNSCYINTDLDPARGQGCGDYSFSTPSIALDAPGELRTFHQPEGFDSSIPTIDDITSFAPDLTLGAHGENAYGIAPGVAFVYASDTNPNPDPTWKLEPVYHSPEGSLNFAPPISGLIQHTSIEPKYQALVRPPAPAYRPNRNSSNGLEALDGLNVASSELWHWTDAINFLLTVRVGFDPADAWWRIAWEDFTNGDGEAFLQVTPFWLRHPVTTPQQGHITAEPLANHIHVARGGRIVHRGGETAM